MLIHDGVVLAAAAEDTAVNFRVQGLNSSVHHFREAGVVGYFGNGQTGVCQQAGGTAGGEQFNAALGKRFGEFNDTGFVRHAEQGPGGLDEVVAWFYPLALSRN